MAREGRTVVTRWLRTSNLAHEAAFYARYRVDGEWCLAMLRSYRERLQEEMDDAEAWEPHDLLSPGLWAKA